MKKIIAVALVGIALFGGLRHKHYATVGNVTQTNRTSDIVTFVDNYGDEWEFYGVEDYEVEDLVAVVMDDNGTEDYREDDRIVSVRYIG